MDDETQIVGEPSQAGEEDKIGSRDEMRMMGKIGVRGGKVRFWILKLPAAVCRYRWRRLG